MVLFWVRACICDIKRPNPAFRETTITDPVSGDLVRVKGHGNIDYRGELTSIPFGYVVCTMHEIHEAFDTRLVRKGQGPYGHVCLLHITFTQLSSFRGNQVPKTPNLLVVKFDTWTAFRAGAMAYRTQGTQWVLTTGLPLESIVMIRDHVGSCLDPYTLDTMEWGILPVTEDEPNTTIDTVQGKCIMPTSERWHCILTTTEMVTSPGLHLLDWQPYQKSWGDEYLSMRHIEANPPGIRSYLVGVVGHQDLAGGYNTTKPSIPRNWWDAGTEEMEV